MTGQGHRFQGRREFKHIACNKAKLKAWELSTAIRNAPYTSPTHLKGVSLGAPGWLSWHSMGLLISGVVSSSRTLGVEITYK